MIKITTMTSILIKFSSHDIFVDIKRTNVDSEIRSITFSIIPAALPNRIAICYNNRKTSDPEHSVVSRVLKKIDFSLNKI